MDGKRRRATTAGRRNGLRRLFWRRYEIESYLIHPEALVRFVMAEESGLAAGTVEAHLRDGLLPRVYRDPLGNHDLLDSTKGKVIVADLVSVMAEPPASRDYWRIAARMEPAEIHPEAVEKLDAIAECFGLTGDADAGGNS